jgi:hypothetical protein
MHLFSLRTHLFTFPAGTDNVTTRKMLAAVSTATLRTQLPSSVGIANLDRTIGSGGTTSLQNEVD